MIKKKTNHLIWWQHWKSLKTFDSLPSQSTFILSNQIVSMCSFASGSLPCISWIPFKPEVYFYNSNFNYKLKLYFISPGKRGPEFCNRRAASLTYVFGLSFDFNSWYLHYYWSFLYHNIYFPIRSSAHETNIEPYNLIHTILLGLMKALKLTIQIKAAEHYITVVLTFKRCNRGFWLFILWTKPLENFPRFSLWDV